MRPYPATDNLLDMRLRNAVLPPDRLLRCGAGGVLGADSSDDLVGQPRSLVVRALVHLGTAIRVRTGTAPEPLGVQSWPAPIPGCAPSLSNPIRVVLTYRTQPQMIGANAQRIIAAMADAQSIWNRTVCQFIRHAVAADLGISSRAEHAVAASPRANPQPTAIGRTPIHLAPEPHGKRLGCAAGPRAETLSAQARQEGGSALFADAENGTLLVHDKLQSCDANPRRVQPRGDFSLPNYTMQKRNPAVRCL
jgi:hypothetical protein